MRSLVWVSLIWVGLAACGGEAITVEPPLPPAPAPVGQEARVPIEALSMSPGCFVPVATSTRCGDTRCTEARQANRDNELAARELLAPFMEISRAMAADRAAAEWRADYTWPAPHDLVTEVAARTPAHRAADAGVFTLDLHDVGLYRPSEEQEPEPVDAVESYYGVYTPNFALVDLKTTIVRWTGHVVSMGPIYRGCDPRTDTSFDARWDDAGVYGLRCWDPAGNDVDCAQVELWPR